MTLPRTAAQVLSGHVTLEVRCIDRLLLTFRQPRLQYGQGIHGFFCHHRGNQFVSSALMRPMTERFAADIRHYIDSRGLDLVRFAKGQSKDEIARRYLAGHDGGEQILFAGVAQEKTRVWRTRQRRDPVSGKRYPWLCQEQAMVNHWYFYGFDADFGPAFIKVCAYFPYPAKVWINGHEWVKRQASGPGSGSPRCPTGSPPARTRPRCSAICDRLAPGTSTCSCGGGCPGCPCRSPPADQDAGYWWELSMRQVEVSRTIVFDAPRHARGFFEALIADNLDIGRPDNVEIIFARKIRLRGKNTTPGSLPDPDRPPRPAAAPCSTCSTSTPGSSSTSRKDGRSAPRPRSTSRAKRTRSSQPVQGDA